ncbi:hypothetical protein, partial [Actinoplanes sp. NPDC051411]|uniref:hypothetical protein n=1 Tax=Actinoplanes sp. NPDC051411 TaxID=3155522 RepID=UPI003419FE0D
MDVLPDTRHNGAPWADAIDVHHHIIPDFYATELRGTAGTTGQIQTVEAFTSTSSANISEGFFQLWILRGRS